MEIDSEANPPKTLAERYRCSACFKQYKKKEHLVEHMKDAYHSVHQPKCGLCEKHCKTFESLREHLTGPLSKNICSAAFAERGCGFCLKFLGSPDVVNEHKVMCRLPAPTPSEAIRLKSTQPQIGLMNTSSVNYICVAHEAIAMDCEMVGGGSDGTRDLCARVCLIDEGENVLFNTYVQPETSVTNYRYEMTGLTEDHLKDAMPLAEVREKVMAILCNGECIEKVLWDGGKAKLLVGHELQHDLYCLKMNYPCHLLRNTAKYHPLLKTNFASHSLKYLTRTYLGYDIQSGFHDPYEDCVSVMRLYKRMRAQDHLTEDTAKPISFHQTETFTNNFNAWTSEQLEKMSPDELVEISRSNYWCWCLDSRQP